MGFTLLVGDVTQQVTVTGEAPLIETTSSSVSGNPRSNAGEITETRTTSRQIQFALKLIF